MTVLLGDSDDFIFDFSIIYDKVHKTHTTEKYIMKELHDYYIMYLHGFIKQNYKCTSNKRLMYAAT